MAGKKGAKAKAMAAAVGTQALVRALTGGAQQKKYVPTRLQKKSTGNGPSVGRNMYGTLAPASSAKVQKPNHPQMIRTNGGRSNRIIHRELIASITGHDVFTVENSFALNPGIAATFPWLSGQAVFWEQYKFNRLKFEYVTRCATSQAGSVCMAPDYDAADAAPLTEQNLSTYQEAVEDAPWKDIVTTLNPTSMHPDGPRKFIRTANVPYGDVKTYDVGKFFVTTSDCGGASPKIGKLWVEYDVELFVPQVSPTGAQVAKNTSMFARNNAQTFTNGVSARIGWDAVFVDALGNTSALPTDLLTFPAGTYLIVFSGCFATTTSDSTFCICSLQKGGASITNANGEFRIANGSAGMVAGVTCQGVVTVNGTEAISVLVQMTGLGALSLVGACSQLLIQPA